MFIIKDWAGNHLFKENTFETFEDGWDFLSQYFEENGMDFEEWAQEYFVIELEFETVGYNDEQYKKYLEEINDLISQDPELNTPEGERLSLLSMAIKDYEGKHFFFNKPSTIEAIRFRMEEQGLIQNDLIPYIGSKSTISEVLSGKRNLTLRMIRALNENLGIPLEVLIQAPKNDINELR